MKLSKSGVIWIIALVVVISVIVVLMRENSPASYDSFAQCLTEKGAKMYGAFWCPHCNDQKEAFGSSWKQVTYIECSTPDGKSQLPVCAAAGIQGYPTWVFADGSELPGQASFGQLSARTGCPLGNN